MRVIGIDPGIATTGWAIVDFESRSEFKLVEYGVITTDKLNEKSERLLEIFNDFQDILDKFKPQISGIETLIFYNNSKTAMAVGESRGVIILQMQKNDIPCYEFTPLQVKSSISGYGNADKKQVQENVKRMFKLDEIPKPDDASDAIAVAVTCFDSVSLNNLMKVNTIA